MEPVLPPVVPLLPQLVQDVSSPLVDLYVPSAHSVQLSASVATAAVEYLPAGQAVQSTKDVAPASASPDSPATHAVPSQVAFCAVP